MRRYVVGRVFQMHALVRRLMLGDAYASPPFARRADRARYEAAAAVRADIGKLGLDAIGAEGAFVGADPRVKRVRRQVLVAIFAVRAELQRHADLIGGGETIIANRSCDSKGQFPS